MALKPNAAQWSIKEQIIEDPASGLTLQFEVLPDGRSQLRVFGNSLPFGNREILFDHSGEEAAGGTFVGRCQPAWITSVSD